LAVTTNKIKADFTQNKQKLKKTYVGGFKARSHTAIQSFFVESIFGFLST